MGVFAWFVGDETKKTRFMCENPQPRVLHGISKQRIQPQGEPVGQPGGAGAPFDGGSYSIVATAKAMQKPNTTISPVTLPLSR